MSEARKCDRCRSFFEPYNYLILAKKEVNENNFNIIFNKDIDLCEECKKAFYKFMEEGVVEHEEKQS